MTPKPEGTEGKVNLTISKFKPFVLQMIYQESEKITHRMGENYTEITCLIRNWYPKYIKNAYRSTTKRKVTGEKTEKGFE